MNILGVDTGGTFTDFMLLKQHDNRFTLSVHKVLSTPKAPEAAILQGIKELNLDLHNSLIVHGTTVATNAALENKGVNTLFITNRGFADILSIGRQAREHLYQLCPQPSVPPVPSKYCREVSCRRDANGDLLQPLSHEDIQYVHHCLDTLKPDAVAICLLFSHLCDQEEQVLADNIQQWAQQNNTPVFTSISSQILPEIREYERGMATWLNAYLGPLVKNYVDRLKQECSPAPLSIMQSTGQSINADYASNRAVNLLLSGPAGGLAAAKFVSEYCHNRPLLTFDMGGTSTDVAMINGDIKLTSEGKIGRYPVAVSMVDMHTIGAGGGSLAYIDEGGLLHVGPESAGASPGPACYNNGGTKATVTDANVVLGRLPSKAALAGAMPLNTVASEETTALLAEPLQMSATTTAMGIIDIANEHMTNALRVISLQRGFDPTEFSLCSFGGAGGLHVCALADNLGIESAIVPIYSGVLSAFGMLVAPKGRELSKGIHICLNTMSDKDINALQQHFDQLSTQAKHELLSEGILPEQMDISCRLDCRYAGQSFSISIPWQSTEEVCNAFHEQHQQLYGHQFNKPIEATVARVSAKATTTALTLPKISHQPSAPVGSTEVVTAIESGQIITCSAPMYQRETLGAGQTIDGPALVCEPTSTTWIAPEWHLVVDDVGNLHLSKQ